MVSAKRPSTKFEMTFSEAMAAARTGKTVECHRGNADLGEVYLHDGLLYRSRSNPRPLIATSIDRLALWRIKPEGSS